MEKPKILFVDDDVDILDMVYKYLNSKGYNIEIVDNGMSALTMVKEIGFDIVFTDYKMPEFNGLELLAAVKKYRPETEVIIVTGYGTMESAIEAMKYGSYDYLQKPFNLEHLKLIIDRIVEEKKIKNRKEIIRARATERHRYYDLIGISPKMQDIYDVVESIQNESPMVLIQGESGTGKELIAKTIHRVSNRRDNPFVPVNCSSISKDLPENKLLDHVRGLVRSAKNGTLYLDEISQIESQFRLKLLQELQREKDSEETSNTAIGSGARIVAGTRKEVEELIKSGALKQDPMNLLSAVFIKLPPLRERKEDISLLIYYFLHQAYEKQKEKVIGVSPDALDILLTYHWPGNVIQLQNVIERAYALGIDDFIRPDDLPDEIKTFSKISKIS